MAAPNPVDLLADAQSALHALLTGKQVVKVRDANGEQVDYNLASADALKAYIQDLTEQVSGTRRCSRPMRIFM